MIFSVWVVAVGIKIEPFYLYLLKCCNWIEQLLYKFLKTTGCQIFPCVFGCLKFKSFEYFFLRVGRYCSGNLLLPSGDNIMATSADNRPPSHWWTPLNLLPSVFLTPLSLFPPLLWPEGQKLRGSELWPFLCCLCVRFTQTSGTCCLSLEWTLSPSSSQSKFELLQLP